jgi:hypothetical protein
MKAPLLLVRPVELWGQGGGWQSRKSKNEVLPVQGIFHMEHFSFIRRFQTKV